MHQYIHILFVKNYNMHYEHRLQPIYYTRRLCTDSNVFELIAIPLWHFDQVKVPCMRVGQISSVKQILLLVLATVAAMAACCTQSGTSIHLSLV